VVGAVVGFVSLVWLSRKKTRDGGTPPSDN
jgi:hypothetical protein